MIGKAVHVMQELKQIAFGIETGFVIASVREAIQGNVERPTSLDRHVAALLAMTILLEHTALPPKQHF